MSAPCSIPENPDIAGIGVRSAIYAQNLLSLVLALMALWDGEVTQGELDYAETLTTTNLVLAFAILISAIVQARTLGITNYHANIILLMSWMNNTNAFVYFILYIHHKMGLSEGKGKVQLTWKAWIAHIRGRFSSGGDDLGQDIEMTVLGPNGSPSIDNRSRRRAKTLIKRFVLVLGSMHLTLMSALGIWLWKDLDTFGVGTKDPGAFSPANACALERAFLTILGQDVPLRSEGLKRFSVTIYALFLAPGANLIIPMALFLGIYIACRRWAHPREATPQLSFVGTFFTQVRNRGLLPAIIGLTILSIINVVFIADIELTLSRNRGLQEGEEDEWGFGQILAILLLLLPVRDLIEAVLSRRLRQRQIELNEDLGTAAANHDFVGVTRALERGATLSQPGSPGLDEELAGWLLRRGIQDHHQQLVNFFARCRGGHVNRKGSEGLSPLLIATQQGDQGTVGLLLENPDVDVNLPATRPNDCDLDGMTALMLACRAGAAHIAQALLKHPDINAITRNPQGQTAWELALSSVEVVNLLATHPFADVNETFSSGDTPLISAITLGLLDIANVILQRSEIDPNKGNGEGNTALIEASKQEGSTDGVQLLLQHPKCNPNVANKQGKTAWDWAVAHRYVGILELLAQHPRTDVNQIGQSMESPLTDAIKNSLDTVTQILLVRPELLPNARHEGHSTPLTAAAERENEGVIQQLLHRTDVDVNVHDLNGFTALIWACQTGNQTITALIMAHLTVDLHATDNDGYTALNWAARGGYYGIVRSLLDRLPDSSGSVKGYVDAVVDAAWSGHGGITEMLLDRPSIRSRLNTPDKVGVRALSWASRRGYDTVVELLLEHPDIAQNVSTHGDDNITALIGAAQNGHETIVGILLACPGLDVNTVDNEGYTALTWAARNGHHDIVGMLLAQADIEVNKSGKDGLNALICASQNGDKSIVTLLLAHPNVELETTGESGQTALAWASINGHEDTVDILLQRTQHRSTEISGTTALVMASHHGLEGLFSLFSGAGPPSE